MSDVPSPRAFAKWGDVRFLFDPERPERIYAQARCTNPFTGARYWHSAGAVLTTEARKALNVGLSVRWRAPHGGCPFGSGHVVNMPGFVLPDLFTALDEALESGLRRGRRPRSIVGTPPAPPSPHGPSDEAQGGRSAVPGSAAER